MGDDKAKVRFNRAQEDRIVEIVDGRIAAEYRGIGMTRQEIAQSHKNFHTFWNEFRELVPFVQSLKIAADKRTELYDWLITIAKSVMTTNAKIAFTAGLWFIFAVVIYGTKAAWMAMIVKYFGP